MEAGGISDEMISSIIGHHQMDELLNPGSLTSLLLHQGIYTIRHGCLIRPLRQMVSTYYMVTCDKSVELTLQGG
jgi:hypothetical protein